MIWQNAAMTVERVEAMLTAIRSAGGTVTHYWHEAGRVCVTWTRPVDLT